MMNSQAQTDSGGEELDPLLYGPIREDGKISAPMRPDVVSPQTLSRGMALLREGRSLLEVARACTVHVRTVAIWRESVPRKDLRVRKPKDHSWMPAKERSKFFEMLDGTYPYQNDLPGLRWSTRNVQHLLQMKFPESAEAQLASRTLDKWMQKHHFFRGRVGWERETGFEAIQQHNMGVVISKIKDHLSDQNDAD